MAVRHPAPTPAHRVSLPLLADDFRWKLKRGDALSLLAIGDIMEYREHHWNDHLRPIPGCAYIFRSLKHPDEVQTLRNIYRSGFFLIAAYCPVDTRLERLAANIARSKNDLKMFIIGRYGIEPP